MLIYKSKVTNLLIWSPAISLSLSLSVVAMEPGDKVSTLLIEITHTKLDDT